MILTWLLSNAVYFMKSNVKWFMDSFATQVALMGFLYSALSLVFSKLWTGTEAFPTNMTVMPFSSRLCSIVFSKTTVQPQVFPHGWHQDGLSPLSVMLQYLVLKQVVRLVTQMWHTCGLHPLRIFSCPLIWNQSWCHCPHCRQSPLLCEVTNIEQMQCCVLHLLVHHSI